MRDFHPDDTGALALVYRNAVITMGPAGYSNAEVCAWALYPYDLGEFGRRLARGRTLVFVEGGEPVAFGQLEPADHIAFLYCMGSHSRQGIATRLCVELERHARACGTRVLSTNASRVSRALFERLGFHVTGSESIDRRGVRLERFKMSKSLEHSA